MTCFVLWNTTSQGWWTHSVEIRGCTQPSLHIPSILWSKPCSKNIPPQSYPAPGKISTITPTGDIEDLHDLSDPSSGGSPSKNISNIDPNSELPTQLIDTTVFYQGLQAQQRRHCSGRQSSHRRSINCRSNPCPRNTEDEGQNLIWKTTQTLTFHALPEQSSPSKRRRQRKKTN